MPLVVGEPIPDLAFQMPDGQPTTLRPFAGKPLLLVFLRHLA